MKIILETEEVLGMIHSALCNGGLQELIMCDVEFRVPEEDYTQAKKEVAPKFEKEGKTLCREDVWAQVLVSGKALTFFDYNDEEEKSFTLESAIEALSTEDAADVVITYKNEGDDAITATELLQHCLYGEVIFG